MTASRSVLPDVDAAGSVWIEITKASHDHGGKGWEFGTCLWSPVADRGGNKRYELMRQPVPGDTVIHWLDTRDADDRGRSIIAGWSKVATAAHITNSVPPSPGAWGDLGPYYRIELTGFRAFPSPVAVRDFLEAFAEPIRAELKDENPKYYPVAPYGLGLRTRQGQYLAHCTANLYFLTREAVGLEVILVGAGIPSAEREQFRGDFVEARRSASESAYFARSAALVRQAKAHYGASCQACGFDFQKAYGDLGVGFVECHHLDPLGERYYRLGGSNQATSLSDVTVLCANCHRMIHRRRPALSLNELRTIVKSNRPDE